MVPRHKIDISAADLLFALLACLTARSPEHDERNALDALGIDENEGLVCLSVRSGLDLLLEALAPPPGAEIVVSAVTHLDMVRILERHRVVPVPVDLDTATLEPRVDLLERALTDRTRAILVAHLFGNAARLGPIEAVARGHGLLLVEDCAQSLGASPPGGDRLADVSLFSFGPIKTATALGGGVLRVADRALLERMRVLQAARPAQARAAYAVRVARFLALAVLARPAVYGALARLVDLDRLVAGSVRGFPGADDELFARLRRRPSPPLVATIARRLRTLDLERIDARARAGEELAALLSPGLARPGEDASRRTSWVFPVVPPDPETLVGQLRRAGFDAARGTTSIGAVGAPEDRPELEPLEAQRLLREVVFLPAYPELSGHVQRRLAAAANVAFAEEEAQELSALERS
jgi:perosamine synthetase